MSKFTMIEDMKLAVETTDQLVTIHKQNPLSEKTDIISFILTRENFEKVVAAVREQE